MTPPPGGPPLAFPRAWTTTRARRRRTPQPFPTRRPLPAGAADHARPLLDPRCGPAVPTLHVRPGLLRHVHPDQRLRPALRRRRPHHAHRELRGTRRRGGNTFFALVQLFIGVGLLFRRTVRPALAVSFSWALGVWVIGEGLGWSSPARPAPSPAPPAPCSSTRCSGSWPGPGHSGAGRLDRPPRRRRLFGRRPGHRPHGHATGRVGRLLVVGRRAVPPARQPDRTSTQIRHRRHGLGAPGWYAHFLTNLANLFSTTGTQTAWILALVSVSSASAHCGPPPRLVPPRRLTVRLPALDVRAGPRRQRLHGRTDPNTGPLMILLAAAMVPT